MRTRRFVLALSLVLALPVVACGEESSNDEKPEGQPAQEQSQQKAERRKARARNAHRERTPARKQSRPKAEPQRAQGWHTGSPVACLRSAGLTHPTAYGRILWRARNNDGTSVRVHAFASKAKARRAVKMARTVFAARAGRYAVFGPLKHGPLKKRDDGSTDAVAACLRRR